MGILDSSLMRWLRKDDAPAAGSARGPRPGRSPNGAHGANGAASQYAPSQFVVSQFANSQLVAGPGHPPAAPSAPPSPEVLHARRKEMLKTVLRETLVHNGVPLPWIAADMLRTTNGRREQGLHMRLLVRHWHPQLLLCGVALEQNFHRRLLAADPEAEHWLMGVSWQYAMDNLEACPPLPHPGSWTAPADDATTAPTPLAAQGAVGGDFIAGSARFPSEGGKRAELERMLAERDAAATRAGNAADSFAATQPLPDSFAATQPMRL